MKSKIFLNVLISFLLALIQISFISNLPLGLERINLIILSLGFILAFFDFKSALWCGLGAGFILDLYSFLPFGFYLSIIFLTIAGANFFLTNFFTNRSFYSFLLLIFVCFAIYEFLFFMGSYLFSFFIATPYLSFWHYEFWRGLFLVLLYNLVGAALIFHFSNLASDRFYPFFLAKK